MNKKHLSPSQINMFGRCESQWFFRYVEGLKKPPGSALLEGGAVDAGVSHNYHQKIDSFEDLSVDEVVDAYTTHFDDGKDNTLWLPDEKPVEIREEGIGLLKTYQKEVAPTLQPATVQDEIYIPIEDFEYDIKGYIDVTTVDDMVNDVKTSKNSPPSKEGGFKPSTRDHQVQLTIYSVGYEVKYGRPPKSLTIDYITKTKTPKVCRAEVEVPASEIVLLQNTIGIIAHKVEVQGNDPMKYMPNRGHFLCSHKFCGYWAECESTYGGEVK